MTQRAPDHVPADVDLSEELVERLITSQFPTLAGQPVRELASGWDNALYRVGERHLVRMPRRAVGATLHALELRWLPELAPSLPSPVPSPLFVGEPTDAYPYVWSVGAFVEGRTVGSCDAEPGASFAASLGRFYGALHALELPDDPPENPHRGTPLTHPRRHDVVVERIERLYSGQTRGALRSLYARACAAEEARRRSWCHGDAHPFNILIREGELAAVIDWGDMTAGDPSVDLGTAWMSLPLAHHDAFFAAHGGVDAPLIERSIGWAIAFGLIFVDVGTPEFARVGERTITRVLATS